jgi:hypothetical protein
VGCCRKGKRKRKRAGLKLKGEEGKEMGLGLKKEREGGREFGEFFSFFQTFFNFSNF